MRERMALLERLHAEHFARVLADLAPHARADHRVLLAGIDAEYANARRAWFHAVATGRADLVKAMIVAWRTYFDVRGRFTEGVALLRPVLEWPERDVEAQQAIAAVRNALSLLLYRKGDLSLSRTVAEAGVLVAERCGDRRALVGCLSSVGSCHSLAGHWQDAQPYFERALQVAQEDGHRAEMAAAFTNLGICAKKDGRFQEALDVLRPGAGDRPRTRPPRCRGAPAEQRRQRLHGAVRLGGRACRSWRRGCSTASSTGSSRCGRTSRRRSD